MKYYLNGLTMVLGSLAYLAMAAFPQYGAVLGVFLGFFAYGITIGLAVCLMQFGRGCWFYFVKDRKEAIHVRQMLSLGVWLLGLGIFAVGLMNGLILTV